ncbi:MAG: pilus assembly protein PilM [Candidatus Hydrogenedentes bacterium]|nr:pilus assembly protein PilM [Candidatus Hydrogenedentota bacterium]
MARKTNYISILQFNERTISLLRARRNARGVDVVAYETEHGEWSASDDSLRAALKAFVERHAVAHDAVCTVLPRHDMTARILSLPSQDPGEIDGMVRLTAEEYVPYPVDELVMAQCILQKLPDGSARVLAVFAHRDVVESHVHLARGAGIEPEQIYVSSACLASAALVALKDTTERLAVVNLASGGLEVLGIDGCRMTYGRALAVPRNWDPDSDGAQAAYEELAVEVRASLSAYRRESDDGAGADRVHVGSDCVDVRHACEILSAETGLECAPARFAHRLVVNGADRLPGLPLVSLGAALAAQGHAPVAISLVPETIVRQRQRLVARRKAGRALALVVALAVALLALYAQALYQRKAYIRRLETRIAALQPAAEAVEQKTRQLARLQTHVESHGTALGLLARLCTLMPSSGINITRFAFVHGQGINIEGRAESEGNVFLLTESLREAGRNDVPEFLRAHQGPWEREMERNQEVIRYTIVIPFPEEADDDGHTAESQAGYGPDDGY